ncbi:MAG TPA: hypothetical protein VIN61_01330 [Gammaproteobacteria bacterium]
MLRFLVLCLVAAAASGCGGRSFEWTEEVRLASGESLLVERWARLARVGQWAHASYRRAISMRLELPAEHGGLVWEGEEWPISLDRIDGRWWIVMPVRGYKACEAYGFPREGVVAFSFDGARWSRGSVEPLLDRLTANLGRPLLDNGRYDTIAYVWSEKFPSRPAPRLREWVVRELEQRDSCIKIRPPYDPAREASLAAFHALAPADRAPVVEAVERNMPPLGKAERDQLTGRWTGVTRLRGCDGLVSDTEDLYATDASGRHLIGQRIGFGGDASNAARNAYIPWPPSLQSITCAADRAFAVLHGDGRRLIVVEYSRAAQPVGAWSYRLSEVDEWFGGLRGMTANFADRGDAFSMTLIDDTGTTRVHLTLPKSSAPIGPATPLAAR